MLRGQEMVYYARVGVPKTAREDWFLVKAKENSHQSSRVWAFDGHLHFGRSRCRAVWWKKQCFSKADTHYLLFCALAESVDCPADNLHQFSGYDCLKNALLAQSGMALKLSLEEAHIQLLSKWKRLGTLRKSIHIHHFVLDFLDFQWKLNWVWINTY